MSDLKPSEYSLLNEFKLRAAAKQTPGTSLTETLSVKTLEGLRKLAKAYSVKGYSKLDKAGLVKVVGEALRDTGRLEEVLYILEKPEWKLFRRVAEEGCLQNDRFGFADNDLLQSLGYIQSYFYESKFFYVAPKEIRDVYATLAAGGLLRRKERSDLIHNYAMAAVNLYGVINQDDFAALFNSQNAVKTDVDEIFPILIRQIAVEKGYCFWDEYIVNDEFADDSDIVGPSQKVLEDQVFSGLVQFFMPFSGKYFTKGRGAWARSLPAPIKKGA
jgi:hypothetical protein